MRCFLLLKFSQQTRSLEKELFFHLLCVAKFFALSQKVRPKKNAKMFPSSFFWGSKKHEPKPSKPTADPPATPTT